MRSLYLHLRLVLAYVVWFHVFLGGTDPAHPDWIAILAAGVPTVYWTYKCNSHDLIPRSHRATRASSTPTTSPTES